MPFISYSCKVYKEDIPAVMIYPRQSTLHLYNSTVPKLQIDFDVEQIAWISFSWLLWPLNLDLTPPVKPLKLFQYLPNCPNSVSFGHFFN